VTDTFSGDCWLKKVTDTISPFSVFLAFLAYPPPCGRRHWHWHWHWQQRLAKKVTDTIFPFSVFLAFLAYPAALRAAALALAAASG
jgi:hypothetical protein